MDYVDSEKVRDLRDLSLKIKKQYEADGRYDSDFRMYWACLLRFLLNLDFEPEIDTWFSMTKTDNVCKSYKLMFKLIDAWTVYEATLKACRVGKVIGGKSLYSVGNYLACDGKKKLDELHKQLLSDIHNWDSKYYKSYIVYLKENCGKNYLSGEKNAKKEKEKWLKKADEIIARIDKDKKNFKVCLFDIFECMYRERNEVFHNGATVRMGTKSYDFRIMLTEHYGATAKFTNCEVSLCNVDSANFVESCAVIANGGIVTLNNCKVTSKRAAVASWCSDGRVTINGSEGVYEAGSYTSAGKYYRTGLEQKSYTGTTSTVFFDDFLKNSTDYKSKVIEGTGKSTTSSYEVVVEN